MKVAYVLGASAGGTGTHAATLARECAARGMDVTSYGPAETGRRFFAWPEAAFVPVDIPGRPRPLRSLAAAVRLRRLLWAPDVVHAHGLRAGAITALALVRTSRRGRRPVLIVTVHNAPARGGPAAAGYPLLERIVARRADAVTWVSEDLAARMRRRGARDGGRALVPAPPAAAPTQAELATARAALADRGADPASGGRPVVLAVGRLTPQKGFDVLLHAAERWRGRCPAPVLAIAGEGPLAEALAGQAQRAGLTVRFLGRRDDVPALLAAADVVVVPSRWEGQPLIVQETLRAGTPLVASRTGGIPDLTGEDAALLVPPGDAGALAAAVASLLDDPRRRAALAGAAAERVAALPTVAAAADAAIALYQRVTARSPAARRPDRPYSP